MHGDADEVQVVTADHSYGGTTIGRRIIGRYSVPGVTPGAHARHAA